MRFDAVIFDIDNVLIDTRASYIDCIRKTVEHFLVSVLNFQPSRYSFLSRKDVEEFKSLGGFNDDWDTCYGLLLYLLKQKIRKRSVFELTKAKDIHRLTKTIKTKPLGVKGAERAFGKQKSVTVKNIAKIFQHFYLTDYVWNEKLLISKPVLKQLKRAELKLGIVTGRSREEAVFALRRFQIDSLFDGVVTTDETPAGLKKPHPYGLLKVAAQLGSNLRFLYVGDLPDDILAARRARAKIEIASCGFLAAAVSPLEMRQAFKKAKSDYVCANVKELTRLIGPIRH